MIVGILAVQGAVAPHRALLEGLGVTVTEVRTPGELAGVDALVMPGGESTTMWHLLGVADLVGPLGDRLAAGMPVLGTCAGMILLAATLRDGRSDQGSFGTIDIAVRRNAYGRQLASFEAPLEVKGLVGPYPGVFIRAPVVEETGAGVEVLATVDGQPVAVRQGQAMALSFHPELTGDDRMHRLFVAALDTSRVQRDEA